MCLLLEPRNLYKNIQTAHSLKNLILFKSTVKLL